MTKLNLKNTETKERIRKWIWKEPHRTGEKPKQGQMDKMEYPAENDSSRKSKETIRGKCRI